MPNLPFGLWRRKRSGFQPGTFGAAGKCMTGSRGHKFHFAPEFERVTDQRMPKRLQAVAFASIFSAFSC